MVNGAFTLSLSNCVLYKRIYSLCSVISRCFCFQLFFSCFQTSISRDFSIILSLLLSPTHLTPKPIPCFSIFLCYPSSLSLSLSLSLSVVYFSIFSLSSFLSDSLSFLSFSLTFSHSLLLSHFLTLSLYLVLFFSI